MKFLVEAAVKEEQEEQVKERTRREKKSKAETKVSTERNVRAERGQGTQRQRGRAPAGFVNQKISRRHASGLITSEGRAGVKGLVGGPPVVNCVRLAPVLLVGSRDSE